MSGIEAIWASPAAEATARALVHFLWQGALAGLAAGGVLALLTRAKASTRYAVALGALLLMAALPVITAVRLAEGLSPRAAAAPASGVPSAPPERTSFTVPMTRGGAEPARTFGASLLPWVFGLWLAGVAALSLYQLGGWRLARRLSRQGRPVGEAVAARARDLHRRLGIGRAVSLLESSAVAVPTVVGWLRPVILVPASALTGLSPAQLEAILAHELAHVRRHDYLVNLLQTAVETLLFYHPAVWWVSSQVRRERENCCDDLAVAVCGNRLSYARALVDLEALRPAPPRLALAASGGSLSERVRRLVGAPRKPARRSWAAGLLALALLPAGAAVQTACARDAAKVKAAAPAEARSGESGALQGRWTAEPDGDDRLRLEMTVRKLGRGRWTSVDSYPKAQFTGLAPGSGARFELRRDAGTFRFEGSFDGRRGRGTFTFTPHRAFAKAMGYGITNLRLLDLALQDVSLEYVRQMKELEYDQVPASEVGSWSHQQVLQLVHRVLRIEPPDTFADRLSHLRRHGVTPEYARGMRQAGYPYLQTWQLVELRTHGIEPGYVKALRESGYPGLFPFRIVKFRTHGITAEWLRGIVEAGYADATPEQLISMHIHAIDGDFIREARARSQRKLRPEELISLSVRGRART